MSLQLVIPIDEIWIIRSEYTYLQQYLVTSRTGFIVVQSYSLNIPSPKRLRLDSLQQNYL